jgi:hypothetical protein
MMDRAAADREATDRISPDRTKELDDGSTAQIPPHLLPTQQSQQPLPPPPPIPAQDHRPAGWPPPPGPPVPSWPQSYRPPQPVIPPLPRSSGRNTTFIVFGVLAALILTGGTWALIMLAGGHSPFGPSAVDDPQAGAPTGAPASPGPVAPLPPASPPSASSPADPGGSSGPTGQVRVTWTMVGTEYVATLVTNGPTGSAEVTYSDPRTGQQLRIRQDLAFVSSAERVAYVGSNPRDAVTGLATAYYLPDTFVLAENEQGNVFVEQVCDETGRCAPATMG